MKSRILSIVLAFSLIAVLFAAIPTKAAMEYTGTVTTTDNAGIEKTNFIQGEPVYVHVKVLYHGAPVAVAIHVALVHCSNGEEATSVDTTTDANGWYNSTAGLIDPDSIANRIESYDVVVSVGGVEIARSPVVVRAVGLTLTPDPDNTYWPGEEITMTLVVEYDQSGGLFYVQVVNWSGATMVNFTDQSAATGYWSKTFEVGATWPDGTDSGLIDHRYAVHVRDKLTHDFWGYNEDFSVQAYEFIVQPERENYLPGDTARISYMVVDLLTLATITSDVAVTYSAEYMNKTGNLTWQNGTLDITKTLWEFTLPTNGTAKTSIALYSDVTVTMWAKQAAGNRNISYGFVLHIGLISASVGLNSASFHPGDTVVVTVDANVNGDPIDGAKVDVTVAKNGTDVVAAYGATNLMTDSDGSATYLFKLAESADLGTADYIVKATVTKVGYSAVRENQFSVEPNSELLVALDQAYYYGGQEVTASFAAFLNNKPVTVDNIGYVFSLGPNVLLFGNTSGTSATVTLNESAYGELTVEAFTHISGIIVGNSAKAPVVFAMLGLSAEKNTFKPGETIVFQWTIVTGQKAANLAYEILDSNGVRVDNGTPTFEKTGSFEFKVPDANPLLSSSYHAYLRMTTPEGGYAWDDVVVSLVSSMELKITIGKSSYTSGEFRPGQKISIHYELLSYNETARATIRLHVSVSYDPSDFDILVDSPTGKISYTIPKNAPMDTHGVYVWAYDTTRGNFLAFGQSTFQVNNQASAWDTSVGGLSAIDLILLILVIVVIIVLIIVPYLKERMARPKPPESKPMEMAQPSETEKAPPSP